MSLITNKTALRQANALTRAAYDLGRNEKRIVYLAINAVLNEKKFRTEDGSVIVDIRNKDYSLAFGCTASNAATQIESAATNLAMAEVKIDTDDGYRAISWTNERELKTSKGVTTIHFNKKLMDLITDVTGDFTRFLLMESGRLKNAYVMRLFESCCQWANSGEFKSDKDWMIEHYALPASYNRGVDFRRRFLDVAVEEINEKTSLKNFHYEEFQRKGKNGYHRFVFRWSPTKEIAPPPSRITDDIDPHQLAIVMHMNIENEDFSKVTLAGIEALKANWFQLMEEGFDVGTEFLQKMAAATATLK